MKIDEISEFILTVAKTEIMPRFQNLKEHEVIMKSQGEFVTAADLATEKAIKNMLLSLYPHAIVTGEEEITKSPQRLAELIHADCGFLIDPIDGTNNFIKGNERFAVMVVAMEKGINVASWIYLPALDKLGVAMRGAGAFLNGQRIILRQCPGNINELIGAAHINRMPEKTRKIARKNLKLFKENRPAFCAGYDYICLIEGIKHFSSYYRTLLWDHLPGTLLYEEAGGYVRRLDGTLYTANNDGVGLLCAPDQQTWNNVKDALFKNL